MHVATKTGLNTCLLLPSLAKDATHRRNCKPGARLEGTTPLRFMCKNRLPRSEYGLGSEASVVGARAVIGDEWEVFEPDQSNSESLETFGAVLSATFALAQV